MYMHEVTMKYDRSSGESDGEPGAEILKWFVDDLWTTKNGIDATVWWCMICCHILFVIVTPGPGTLWAIISGCHEFQVGIFLALGGLPSSTETARGNKEWVSDCILYESCWATDPDENLVLLGHRHSLGDVVELREECWRHILFPPLAYHRWINFHGERAIHSIKKFEEQEAGTELMGLGKTRSPTPGNRLRLWATFVTNAAPFDAAQTEEINMRESISSPSVCGVVHVKNKQSYGEDDQIFMGWHSQKHLFSFFFFLPYLQWNKKSF